MNALDYLPFGLVDPLQRPPYSDPKCTFILPITTTSPRVLQLSIKFSNWDNPTLKSDTLHVACGRYTDITYTYWDQVKGYLYLLVRLSIKRHTRHVLFCDRDYHHFTFELAFANEIYSAWIRSNLYNSHGYNTCSDIYDIGFLHQTVQIRSTASKYTSHIPTRDCPNIRHLYKIRWVRAMLCFSSMSRPCQPQCGYDK